MRLAWSARPIGASGLDRGVLYLADGLVVPWNGLVSVDVSENDEIDTTRYIDGVRYVIIQNIGHFTAVVEAFAYPPVLDAYFGARTFNLSYRSGHEIHLVYNALARETNRTRKSSGKLLDPALFGFDLVASPALIDGAAPSAHLVIDTTEADANVIKAVEDQLYGSETTAPSFPTTDEIRDIFETAATLIITDHGDGTWSATGPDDMIETVGDDMFAITTPSAEFVQEEAIPEGGQEAMTRAAAAPTQSEETAYIISSY